ncbi:MAG: Chaperone protein SicA [Chlamydiae bacterium]|nr:Chaperone protein SicA [Chlamydiota bacterium]
MYLRQLLHRIALNRKEDAPFPENLEAYLDDFIPNILLKSETFQEAFGVLNAEMEVLYKEAYDFYQEDRYHDALTVFRWLVVLNPYKYDFWMGLGAAQQLLSQSEKALHAYAAAALLDCENPDPHFYAHECYVEMGEKEEAEKALELSNQRKTGKAANNSNSKSEEVCHDPCHPDTQPAGTPINCT